MSLAGELAHSADGISQLRALIASGRKRGSGLPEFRFRGSGTGKSGV
jgi:hypothetical protein